jgi:uncharacterized membrane protein (UPF0182 family)
MRLMRMITLAIASIFAMTSVQAASFMTPATKTTSDSIIEQVAKKKSAKKPAKKAKKKKAAAAKAGKCGTYNYFDKKTKKCVDARGKK